MYEAHVSQVDMFLRDAVGVEVQDLRRAPGGWTAHITFAMQYGCDAHLTLHVRGAADIARLRRVLEEIERRMRDEKTEDGASQDARLSAAQDVAGRWSR